RLARRRERLGAGGRARPLRPRPRRRCAARRGGERLGELRQVVGRARHDAGAKLAVLAAPFASPTLARLARELRSRYPAMRWASWDPLSEEAIFAGNG